MYGYVFFNLTFKKKSNYYHIYIKEFFFRILKHFYLPRAYILPKEVKTSKTVFGKNKPLELGLHIFVQKCAELSYISVEI